MDHFLHYTLPKHVRYWSSLLILAAIFVGVGDLPTEAARKYYPPNVQPLFQETPSHDSESPDSSVMEGGPTLDSPEPRSNRTRPLRHNSPASFGPVLTEEELTYQKIHKAIQQRLWTHALEEVNKHLASDPQNPQWHNLQGRIFCGQRQFALGEAAFQKSIQLFTIQNGPVIYLASTLELSGKCHLSHGEEAELLNDTETAEEHFQIALDHLTQRWKKLPRGVHTPALLSILYSTVPNPDLQKAQYWWTVAQNEKPNHPWANWAKAKLLSKQNRPQEALEALQGTLKNAPFMPEPYRLGAELELTLQHPYNAYILSTKGLDLAPNHLPLRWTKIKAAEQVRSQEALTLAKSLLDDVPEFTPAFLSWLKTSERKAPGSPYQLQNRLQALEALIDEIPLDSIENASPKQTAAFLYRKWAMETALALELPKKAWQLGSRGLAPLLQQDKGHHNLVHTLDILHYWEPLTLAAKTSGVLITEADNLPHILPISGLWSEVPDKSHVPKALLALRPDFNHSPEMIQTDTSPRTPLGDGWYTLAQHSSFWNDPAQNERIRDQLSSLTPSTTSSRVLEETLKKLPKQSAPSLWQPVVTQWVQLAPFQGETYARLADSLKKQNRFHEEGIAWYLAAQYTLDEKARRKFKERAEKALKASH